MYYQNKAEQILTKIGTSTKSYKSNFQLLRAIIAIENAHRNIIWRFAEYLFFLIVPIDYSIKKILTIGKIQVKVKYLTRSNKFQMIKDANRIETLDYILFDNFQDYNWNKLSVSNIDNIIAYYNGDKTGKYRESLTHLINIQNDYQG